MRSKNIKITLYGKSSCIPCNKQAEILKSLIKKYPSIELEKLNVQDMDKEELESLYITSVPVVVITKDGFIEAVFRGLTDEKTFIDFLG